MLRKRGTLRNSKTRISKTLTILLPNLHFGV
jgi:hypothetical protein